MHNNCRVYMTPLFIFDTKTAVGLLPDGNDECKNIRICKSNCKMKPNNKAEYMYRSYGKDSCEPCT